MKGFYTAPDYALVREQAGALAGGAASTAYAKFRSFSALKLLRVNAHVVTAGTNAGHGYDVYIGTQSVATLNVGTLAAGGDVEVAVADALASAPAKADVYVKSKSDIVGVSDITFEFQEAYAP